MRLSGKQHLEAKAPPFHQGISFFNLSDWQLYQSVCEDGKDKTQTYKRSL